MMWRALVAVGVFLAIFCAVVFGELIFNRRKSELKPWQIDPNQPCPACGHAVGSIKFDETIKEIRHRCSVCEATWGEPTVVKVDDWRKKTPQPEVPFQWG